MRNYSFCKKSAVLIGITLLLSACSLLQPVDTSGVRKINEEEAKSCTPLSGDLKDRNSHAAHHEDNMLRVLDEAKQRVVREQGNAYLVKSFTFDFDHNTSRIIYQVFSCK